MVELKYPSKVNIYEVGPRDGLQNEKKIIPTKIKVALIDMLTSCNFKEIEIGSFVSPKWVPQMQDSLEVDRLIKKKKNIKYPILVPNLKGLEKAIAENIKTICVFTTASESFSKKNTNCTVTQSLKRIEKIIYLANKNGIKTRGYISCVMGCPYEGSISFSKTANICKELNDLGCYEISLGDTIGVGTPIDTVKMLDQVLKYINIKNLAVHFHDTYGQALSNILASLQKGIFKIDSSIGGLGGCPFAKGAKGNVATEDVVFMLNGMNISTGLTLKNIVKISKFIFKYLEREPSSRVTNALR